MTFKLQCCWLLLLVVSSAWALEASEYLSLYKLLDDPYEQVYVSSNGIKAEPTYPASKRVLSLQMMKTHKYGLPKCSKERNDCRKIGIVGAGAAGLYSGILLANAGHTVTIYEASDRAGGRVLTYRDPQNPSIYMGDLGPMRLPLDAQPYVSHLVRERYKLNITEFFNSNPNAYAYVNGILATLKQVNENPDIFRFNTSKSERGLTAGDLWLKAIQPILQTLKQGGWLAARQRWDSYSIDSYLMHANLSRPAIDYLNVLEVFETRGYTSILENIRSKCLYSSGVPFYRIIGGTDLLIQRMVDQCQKIDSNRCSITYSIPTTEVRLIDRNQVQWITRNGTSDIFDSIIIATSAPAAELIAFEPRVNFTEKYRALRQVHMLCSTKILLFFNESWWHTQEHISGGHSVTDLNIRRIYYSRPMNNQTTGGTILASYVTGLSSVVWQSLSDSDAIDLALNQVIELHRSSRNIRDYFQGGKAKHWCRDPHAHGAFATFLPFQETMLLDQLQGSVSNIHFIGEHTSLIHGWIEGAIISALRGALSMTAQESTLFDVVIVGGNPVGLMTAVLLSWKQPSLRIAIIEQGAILDLDVRANTYDRQPFRQIFHQEYLAELANASYPLWRQLEQLANLSYGSILNTDDGYLIIGDMETNQSTVEGNFLSMKRTCAKLQMHCEYLNSTQLQTRYRTFRFPPGYGGIFHNQSGYINVTMLMISLLRLVNENPNIFIRQNEEFLSLKLLDNRTQLVTDRGILYASRKVLFIPGSDAKNISNILNLNLNIKLWELPTYYFRSLPTLTRLPNWLSLGDHHQSSLFSGFPIDPTSDYIVVKPNFIQNISNTLNYPSQQTNTVDPVLTAKVIDWVYRSLGASVNLSDYYVDNRTYLTSFLPDSEYLLDYVPQTNRRVLMQAAGLETDFAPIWADILSEMILSDRILTSRYAKYMDYFSFARPNRLVAEQVVHERSTAAMKSTDVTRSTSEGTTSSEGYHLTLSVSLLFVCLTLVFNIDEIPTHSLQ